LLFNILGCGVRFGESAPATEAREFSGTQCLSRAKPVVKAFIQGEARTEDLSAAWDCVSSALLQFKKYVRGKNADRYTSQEIATFLEQNYLEKGTSISPELQFQFMKLKLLLVGGTTDFIATGEIDKATDAISTIKQATIVLNPYMKVLIFKWSLSNSNDIQKDMKFFEGANMAVQNASNMIADLIEKNGQQYVLSDFISLCKELSTFFGEDWSFIKTVTKYMPVVQKVKKALAGGNETTISASEWRRFATLGSRGFVQYLRYYYFIESAPQTGTGFRLAYISRTIEDLFSVFQDLVKDKPEGVVSREEMTDILNTLSKVWPDFKVSDNLVFQGMKLKQLFFGGSVDSWTTTDFNTARLMVTRLRVLIERFLPYYSIYGFDWDPSEMDPDDALKFFSESRYSLEATARELGTLFEGNYDLNDLQALLQEVEVLYPPRKDSTDLSLTFKKYMPLIVDVKNVFLGGTNSTLLQAQWSGFLGDAARLYSDGQFYYFFLKDADFKDSDALNKLSMFGDQSLNILRDMIADKKEGQVSLAELNKLAARVMTLDLLPSEISQNSISQVLDLAVNNILEVPEKRVAGEKPNALTLSSVEVARHEIQGYIEMSIYLNKIIGVEDVLGRLKADRNKETTSANLKEAIDELMMMVQSPLPFTFDDKGRVIISNRVTPKYTQRTFIELNFDRVFSRLAIRSFAGDIDRIRSYTGVNLQEVQKVFTQLNSLVVELGLIDKSNTNFASARFRDANLFVPHSDGDSLASFTEMADLVGAISSGLRLNSDLEKELQTQCSKGESIWGNDSSVSIVCAKKAYWKTMPKIMTSSPEFVKWMGTRQYDEWDYYSGNVFKAAGYVPSSTLKAKVSDLSLSAHVIQYIELMLARFNKSKNGTLSTSDAIRAFPLFKPILEDLAKDQIKSGTIKESELIDLFAFIVKYGRAPTSLKDKVVFMFFWKGKRDSWDIGADRSQLAAILGYIADQTSKASLIPDLSNVPDVPPDQIPDASPSGSVGSGAGSGSGVWR
jgi:hypothetical protein